jgi:predicted nucleic acid-binding protein
MFEFVLSTPLVLEYEMVLKRSGIVALTFAEIDELLDILCAIGLRQKLWYLWRPILADAGDDFIAELAANGQADFIVTFNKRLFESMRTFGVNVCSPVKFLKLLGV